MAFRLPSQKKFKPNLNKNTVPRKASIPASLARPSSLAGPSSIGTAPRPASQIASGSTSGNAGPTPTPDTLRGEDSGTPIGLGSLGSGPPALESSTQTQSQTQTETQIQTPGSFREPSLPPSRKRAASPTPSNASRSSRTGGRPTLIHLAASSGPARRPTGSPSPAPVGTAAANASTGSSSASVVPTPAVVSTPGLGAASVRPSGSTTANGVPSVPVQPTKASTPASVSAPGRPSQSPRHPTPSAPSAPTAAQHVTSPTPPPPSYASGPPTIGSSQMSMPPGGQGTPRTQSTQSSLIDPQLLDQTPGAGPSRSSPPPPRAKTTAEIASELVAGIATMPPGKKLRTLRKNGQPRKPYSKRAPRAAKEKDKDDGGEGDGRTEDGSDARASASVTPGPEQEVGTRAGSEVNAADNAPPARRPRKRPRQKTPEYDEDGKRIRKARGPYKSRGRANTEYDRRLSKFRAERPRQSRSVSDVPASGEDVDPFAEDIPIDPELLKMGSFASNFYDGDMTERAVLLRTTQKTKREDSQRERLEFERVKWIRLQPLRRRERAKRNEERSHRRAEWEANGAPEGDEEVSDDEIDSTDEEYEFEPDRLTPPGTPEQQYADEEGEGEEQEGIRPDERNPDEDDEEEGLGLDVHANYDHRGEGSEYDEEVEPETREMDFAAHGIDIVDDPDHENADQTANQDQGDPNEPDPDYAALFDINPGEDEEHEGYEDGGPGFSFADYTANQETRRELALSNQNSRFVTQEDDDETRMVNSISWQKRERTDKWTDDETDFFYSVLGEVGENYTMMKAFFPGRSVAQIKKKGIRENAKNPEKVTAAINARRPIGTVFHPSDVKSRLQVDNHYLMKSAGYDPDRPWDKEEALFAEAKRDMTRLRAEDRGEVVDEVGDPDDEHHGRDYEMGDETMDFDAEHQVDGGEDGNDEYVAGGDEEVEGAGDEEAGVEAVEVGEGEGEGGLGVAGEEEAGEAGQGDLFLPGAESP